MQKAHLGFIVETLGFCFYLSLSAFTYWGSLTFLPTNLNNLDVISIFQISFQSGFLPCFLFYALLASRFPNRLKSFPFWITAGTLSGGFISLVFAAYLPLSSIFFLVLAGIEIGFGSASSLVYWESIFAIENLRQSQFVIIVASLFSALPFLALSTLNQEMLLFVLTFIFAPLCTITLYISFKAKGLFSPFVDIQRNKTNEASSFSLKREVVPLLCIFILGLMQRMISILGFGESSLANLAILSQLGCAAAALLLFFFWIIMRKNTEMSTLYLILAPILEAALILWVFIPSLNAFLVVLLSTVFCLISMIIMMECVRRAQEKRINLVVLYALYAFVLYLSLAIGRVTSGMVTHFAGQGLQVVATVFILIYVLSLIIVVVARFQMKSTTKVSNKETFPYEDILSLRCASLAKKHELTPREAEIMEYMVHGRSASFIAYTLYISENTVRTYQKSLYRKLDVHTKQELINML